MSRRVREDHLQDASLTRRRYRGESIVLELVQVHVVVTLVLAVLVAAVVAVQGVLRRLRPLLQRDARVDAVSTREPHVARTVEPARV